MIYVGARNDAFLRAEFLAGAGILMGFRRIHQNPVAPVGAFVRIHRPLRSKLSESSSPPVPSSLNSHGKALLSCNCWIINGFVCASTGHCGSRRSSPRQSSQKPLVRGRNPPRSECSHSEKGAFLPPAPSTRFLHVRCRSQACHRLQSIVVCVDKAVQVSGFWWYW